MQTNKQGKRRESQPPSSTVTMLANLLYLVTVCWVIPVVPMVIVWVLRWSFGAFLVMWVDAMPLLITGWYLLFKASRE